MTPMRNTKRKLYDRAVECSAICPHCWRLHDCASVVNGTKPTAPKVGDFSCCHNCGEFSVFDDRLELIPITDTMMQELPPQGRRALEDARIALKRGS